MDINANLFVEIVPLESPNAPVPHPVRQARFDMGYVYKVLGMYNPSETSECYFVLANLDREIWFIPQRHVRAYKLINSNEFFLPKDGLRGAGTLLRNGRNGVHPGMETGDRTEKSADMAGPISPMPIS